VLSGSEGCKKFHLRGSLVNHSVKTGTVHRLEARVSTPSGISHSFDWKIFFAYAPGTLNVQPAGDPIPVSVPGKSSQLLLVEFELPAGAPIPAWAPGRYQLEITGWVNKANRKRSRNLAAIIHFSLHASQAQQLSSQAPGQATVINIPVEEWVP